MDRNQIIRDDFPLSRKGWDPTAVRDHLEAVADAVPAAPETQAEPSLGNFAASRVAGVLEAAEVAAREIESSSQSEADGRLRSATAESERVTAEARAEADAQLGSASAEAERVVAEARAEAERVVSLARTDSEAHVKQAQQGVEGLVAQTEELRAQVATLGESLTAAMPTVPAPAAEVPGPVIVPEPTPPSIPEPTPDPVPEPTPDPMPEPTPDPPAPDLPDEPEPLEPPVPEPAPEPPAAEPDQDLPAAGASTEDLIAQLRSSPSAETAANGSDAASGVSGSDLGAARLVAMNMALDGDSREEITTQLSAEFGEVPDIEDLVDEVFERAGR